jgi:endonuclease III
MKNAKVYAQKIRKLLKGMPKTATRPADGEDPVRALVVSVLEANGAAREARKALAALEEEFVDFNELRVAQPKELAERMGKDYPDARARALMIHTVLNNITNRVNKLSMAHLDELPKRQVKKHLMEQGLSPYAAACVSMFAFDAPCVPVDEDLAECLEMKGLVEPGTDTAEVQAFLDRTVPVKQAERAHAFFRKFVSKNAKALAKKREAEARAREEAEAKARAEEEARQKAEAEAEAKAKKKAAKKARKKAKAKRKSTAPRPARKRVPKKK